MNSRFLVFLVPIVVIAIFWMMANRESKLAHDPTHKGFFERNGAVLGLAFVTLVAFWTLFLVTLPYLYMVVESFHPRLPPLKRGGPEDFLTLEQYKSFFFSHLYKSTITVTSEQDFAVCGKIPVAVDIIFFVVEFNAYSLIFSPYPVAIVKV